MYNLLLGPTTGGQLILVVCTLRDDVAPNALRQVTENLAPGVPRKTKGGIMKNNVHLLSGAHTSPACKNWSWLIYQLVIKWCIHKI